MLEKLKKRATAALPKVVNGVKALAKKTTKTVVEKFQESKAGKLIGKAVASVPACVNNTRNTISKLSAAIPKVKQATKNEAVKRVNTVREEVSKAENTVKTNMAKASNFANASKSLVTEKAGQEKIKQLFFEKNQRILEKIKEENKIFAADFIKGTTGRGALLYSTSKALKVPIPGAFNLSIEVMNYILQIRKAVVEEYPTIDWASNVYKELKQESGSYFNQLGNITYNKNIPFLSDLIGAFTNSSDYQKHGNQTPLDDVRYKIINDALIMAKPSLIPGVPGTIIKGIKISQKENVASTEGAYDRGFLIEGAGGMAEGIVNLVISPYDTAEGIVNIYKEPEKYIPAILKTANEYVNDKVIHGSPEDKAKLAGRVRFEAMALAASFIGGGAEAPGVLGKTGEITEIGKATEAPGVLGKTGEINEIGKAAGVEQKLTEFNEAAKIAKGAETAGELTKGENLIEELLGKMRKLFKGDIGPEEAGQVANKEAGVSIRKVEVGAKEVGDVGKAVGSEGEAIKGTSNAGKAGEAIEGTGKIKYDINGKYTGGRTQNELNALEYDPAKKAITNGSKNEAKIGLDLEEKGIIGQLERSPDPKAEFIDSITGKKYDVKSFESTPMGSDGVPITSPRKGAFKAENAMKNIVKEFERNGNDIVIIDKSKLLPEHVNELTNAIEGAGLSDKIIWWPE